MTDIFAKIVFAHLFADYLFQPKKMAILKSEKSLRGIMWCVFHCLIYTATYAIFFRTINPIFLSLIFLSHFPIDRWSLGQKWLDFIKGRNILKAFNTSDQYREIDIAFSSLVYAVVDNTMHLFLVWLIVRTIF